MQQETTNKLGLTLSVKSCVECCNGDDRKYINKKYLKNVGPICHCKPFYIAIHKVSLLSHAACASMSTTTTTTTTTTTRDRWDRYGPIGMGQV